MKKFTLAFLFFILVTNSFSQEGFWTDKGNYDISWYDNSQNEFTISTPQQLAGLAYLINCDQYLNIKISLCNDVDLSTHYWLPIPQFYGIFNGNNHKITNMNIYNNGQTNAIGFFAELQGTVKQLIIDASCKINDVNEIKSAKEEYGFIAGTSSKEIIECTNYASIQVNSHNVGGIVGSNYGVITKCINYGNITMFPSEIYGFGIGGIVGYNHGEISNCQNYGNIIGEENAIGGIIGKGGKIVACENYGNITNTYKGIDSNVGGIIGEEGAIEDCTNFGTILGEKNSGGIVGVQNKINFEIKNCCNQGTVKGISAGGIIGSCAGTGTINSCSNTGTIEAYSTSDTESTNAYAGGIAGFAWSGFAINCSNSGNISATAKSYDNNPRSKVLASGIGTNEVYNCFNTGNIYGHAIASTESSQLKAVTKVYAAGITARGEYVGNCYNTGNVVGERTETSPAGESPISISQVFAFLCNEVITQNYSIENSYFCNTDIDAYKNGGRNGYMTLSDMQTSDFTKELNTNRKAYQYNNVSYSPQEWIYDSSMNNSLPYLKNNKPTSNDLSKQKEKTPFLFHNISSDYVTLNMDITVPVEITVYTQSGQKIDQYNTTSNTLNVKSYPSDIYIINVKCKNINRSEKIIIRH